MEKLDIDLIRKIGFYLPFENIINYSSIDKFNYEVFDNQFYKNYAFYTWSKLFWTLALQRNVLASKPLKSWKLELLRIENYQKFLEKNNNTRWVSKDFFNYWKQHDIFYINK